MKTRSRSEYDTDTDTAEICSDVSLCKFLFKRLFSVGEMELNPVGRCKFWLCSTERVK